MARLIKWAFLILLAQLFTFQTGAQLIDAFNYTSSLNATSSWRAGIATQPARPNFIDGLELPVTFADGRDRVYWDFDTSLNLREANSIELDLTCHQPDVMRTLSIYFRSGSGWYIWSQPLQAAGRQRLNLQKSDFATEGNVSGWDRIDRVRISPWKGRPVNSTLVLHHLAGRKDTLYLIQATVSAPNAKERSVARRTAERVSDLLTDGGIPHAVVPEDQLDDIARNARVIILPYNPRVTAGGLKSLKSFVNRGGKLLVFYSSDDQLAGLMQVRLGDITKTRDIARLRSIDFTEDAPEGVPESVHQQSWNLGKAKPANRNGRVIAWWSTANGKRSKDAAVIQTPAGYWFTHILLGDDKLAKKRMLTALLASLDQTIWKETAAHALLNAGRIDGWSSAPEAVEALNLSARNHPHEETIRAFTHRIERKEHLMQRHYEAGRFREATMEGYDLTDLLINAYGLAQRPKPGEIAAVWEHDGTGWYPGDWERTAKLLADSGINTIFINATWAGLAHYKSAVLPESYTHRYYRDQLEQCLKAARKYNLSVHAWIVCWYLENAPDEFKERFKGTEVLEQNAAGQERYWMNPAHPESIKHHLAIIEEILDRYDVDGIHLDYIRYPDSDAGYSPYSRGRFESVIHKRIADWPRDVQPGGIQREAFVRWRADNITGFVRQARDLIKGKKPNAKLSAAVWGGYPAIVNSIGQDWMTWIQLGYVDFLCPMNYANDLFAFTSLLDQQLAYPGVRTKIIPGIGVTANESQLRGDEVIEQILALRKRGVGGFALFDLSQTVVDDVLPALRMGVTKPVPAK